MTMIVTMTTERWKRYILQIASVQARCAQPIANYSKKRVGHFAKQKMHRWQAREY